MLVLKQENKTKEEFQPVLTIFFLFKNKFMIISFGRRDFFKELESIYDILVN